MAIVQAKENHRKPSRRRLISFLRKAIFYLIAAAAVIYALSFAVTAPLAKWQIQKISGHAVYIQSGHLSGIGRLKLKGLVISPDRDSFATAPILQSDKVEIQFEPYALLKGVFSISSVVLEDFLVSADVDQNKWNFFSAHESREPVNVVKLPLIELRKGAFRIRRKTGSNFELITIGGMNGIIAGSDNRQYHFMVESDGRFGYEGTKLQGELTIAGNGQKNHLSAGGTICMPGARVFENSWNLRKISLECLFDNKSAQVKRLSFESGHGQVDISGTFDPEHKQIDVALHAENIPISDRYAPDTLVYSEPVLDWLDPGLRKFLRRFHPAGTGDAELKLTGRLDDLSQSHLEGRLTCRDIRVLDERFPYLIEHMTGRIVLSGRNLAFEAMQARHKESLFSLSGGIQNTGPAASIDFQMVSESLPLDEDLFKALNPQTKKIWYTFAPSGTMGLVYRFVRMPDGGHDLTMTLKLKTVSAVYKHFPYPLENLQGDVIIKQDAIVFDRLASSGRDGSRVALSGRISDLKNEFPTYAVSVNGENIAVNQSLANAMPAQQRAYFDLVDVNALADVDLKIGSGPQTGGQPDFTAHVRLDGDRLVVKEFPVSMTGLRMEADITPERIDLQEFRADAQAGEIRLSGQILKEGFLNEQRGVCLDVDLRGLELDASFWQAANKQARPLLGDYQLHGLTDLQGHFENNVPADLCGKTSLTLNCRGSRLYHGPDEIGIAEGKVHYQTDQLGFEDFQFTARHIESLPAEVLTPRLKSFMAWAEPSGDCCLMLRKGSVQLGVAEPRVMDLTGEVILSAISCGKTKPVEDLAGVVSGHLQSRFEQGQWNIEQFVGQYNLDSVTISKCQLTNLQGPLAYDPSQREFRSSSFGAQLYGGDLAGSWDISILEPVSYRVSMAADNVDIRPLLSSMSPGNDTRGLARARLELEGVIDRAALPDGRFSLTVRDMRLGQQSMLGKILTAIQLKEPKEYIFSGFELDASVHGNNLLCERVRIAGDPLIFYGSGSLDLSKERVELELVGIDRIFGNEDTIVNMLARGVGSAIWKIQVTGTMQDPEVDTVYLSVLKQPLELFKRKEPR